MPASTYPRVSILLPIRNEAIYIERCLNAVLAQEYSGAKQILVVDGMSNDGTREIVKGYIDRQGVSVIMLDNSGGIVPFALNTGLQHAKGNFIIRVDGHTIIAPDYVRQCVEALQRTGADNVGGKMTAVGTNPFGKAVALATSSPFGVGGARFHYSDEEEWVDTVYLGAWPRRVFEKIGLFDEELVRDQDDEFNYRLRAAGGKILLSPKIKSEYTVRSTPKALWRQYFQYGYWKVRVLQKHPRQMRPRQFVPPAFVLALLGSALLAFIPVFRPLSPVIPVLYLAANLTATILTVLRPPSPISHPPSSVPGLSSSVSRPPSPVLILPLVYALLHLSYGLGFLVGLVRFWNRWGDRVGRVPAFDPGA